MATIKQTKKIEVQSAEPIHPLTLIFDDVVHQVVDGKGVRHGGGTIPFYQQKWVGLAETHGNGFLTGQAAKKLDEAVQRMSNGDMTQEEFERELIGSIAYLGMALLQLRGYPMD